MLTMRGVFSVDNMGANCSGEVAWRTILCKCVTAVLLLLFINWYAWMRRDLVATYNNDVVETKNMYSRDVGLDICHTQECVDAADNMLGNRNQSVEPCNNFYEFACGGWIGNHPVPENKTRVDQFEKVFEVTSERIKDILEREVSSTDLQVFKDARQFYRACLDADGQAKQNMAILLERLAMWGGWPMATSNWNQSEFDWKKVLLYFMRTTEVYPLLSVTVGADRKNTSRSVIIIDQGYKACNLVTDKRTMMSMATFIINIAVIIAEADNQTVSRNIESEANLLTMLEFQLCLASLGRSDRKNAFLLYNPMTIAELQNMTDNLELSRDDSKIDWVDFLNGFLEGTGINVSESQTVIVPEPHYLVELLKRIDKISQRTLANYLLWFKVFSTYRNISPELRHLGYKLEEEVTGTSHVWPRWRTCVFETNKFFRHAVGYEYAKLYLDPESKKNVEELVSNILKSFTETVKRVTWMDEETRAAAVEKVNNLVVHVGYPDWYSNITNDRFPEYEIESSHILNLEKISTYWSLMRAKSLLRERDRKLWVTQVAAVSTFYILEKNSISIPAGIFQPPFYVKGRLEAINYGAIGSIIAHEISHAFDVSGRNADRYGNLVRWWSKRTSSRYQLKQTCIETQYSEYPVPELFEEATEDTPERLDGSATVRKNIADYAGVQEAFAAYGRAVSQHGEEPSLPGLETYSPQQLFYMGYASIWCESGNKETLLNDIRVSEHSPSKYRVLIPLGNFRDFAKVWRCRPSEFRMKPARLCNFCAREWMWHLTSLLRRRGIVSRDDETEQLKV